MGLFDKLIKSKSVAKKTPQEETLEKLVRGMNKDGWSLSLFDCPNGCVDCVVRDRTDAPISTEPPPRCPKCGTFTIPRPTL